MPKAQERASFAVQWHRGHVTETDSMSTDTASEGDGHKSDDDAIVVTDIRAITLRRF